jgi:hypothetical protein
MTRLVAQLARSVQLNLETAVKRDSRNTQYGEFLALTPALSRRARGFAPFALREKGWG